MYAKILQWYLRKNLGASHNCLGRNLEKNSTKTKTSEMILKKFPIECKAR